MKSRLAIIEFKNRLKESTTSEIDFYFLSPYKISGEPFCGEFNDSSFDLTRNTHWRHIKAIEIKGRYKKSTDSTEVAYSIGLSKFLRNFSIVFFCVIVIESKFKEVFELKSSVTTP
jgi:hypothetical protein